MPKYSGTWIVVLTVLALAAIGLAGEFNLIPRIWVPWLAFSVGVGGSYWHKQNYFRYCKKLFKDS